LIPYYALVAIVLVLFILIFILANRRRPPLQWYLPPSPSNVAGAVGEKYARRRRPASKAGSVARFPHVAMLGSSSRKRERTGLAMTPSQALRRQLSPILPSPFGHIPGRNHRFLPAWATNVPPARLFNASRPQRGRLSEVELEIGRAKNMEELRIGRAENMEELRIGS